ncbi:MAG: hypothetical protein FJ123_00765 [Deltaproteobacteria bacterium]|nr:hypothetical protein [Deltaproteobacteria bacterium]
MSNFITKNRVPIMVAVWMGLLVLFIYSYAQAVNTVAQGKSKISDESVPSSLLDSMIGSGSASILRNEDIEEAKGKALKMARDEAILKVVGLHVSPEILAKEKDNILKYLTPEQDNIIKESKIVSENQGEDGFYRVKISATIREDMVKTLLTKNLYDDRVIVITSEKNLGNYLKRHVLEHDLIKGIKDKGYLIVDYRTVKNDRVRGLVSAIRQGNTESVKKMGIYYLTDIVVVGFVESKFSQQTKDIYSANATGQVKIHQIGSKKEVSSLTKHNLKGFGSDEEKAGIDAIKKISKQMAEEAMKSFAGKSVKKVKLTIKEIGGDASFRKAKTAILSIPYVKEVSNGISNLDIEEITLYLKTTKSADYIAKELSELKYFVIKKVGKSEILAEARKI